MKNIIFVTDIHFNKPSSLVTVDDVTGNSRFTEQLDTMQKVYDMATEHNATIINGGDLFHKRKVPMDVFNDVYKLMVKNRNFNADIYHLVGNHDLTYSNKIGSNSSVEVLDFIDHNKVIKLPEQVTLSENIELYFLPYGDDISYLKNWVLNLELDKRKTNILIGHIGVSGSTTGSSSRRLDGEFVYADLRPDDFDYILLGHYHNKQVLGDGTNPKHIYGGSLLQNNFGETHIPGVHLLSIGDNKEDNTIEFIEVPSKRYVTLTGDSLDTTYEADELEKLFKDSFVRYQGTVEEAKAIENVIDDTSNITFEISKDYVTETRIDISEENTPQEITERYVETFYPDGNVKKVALECLNEALAL